MTQLKKYLFYFSLLYCLVCFMQSLFFTENFIGYLDNLLFPFGAIYASFYFWDYLRHDRFGRSIFIFVFTLFLSDIVANSGLEMSDLPYLLSFVKMLVFVPVIHAIMQKEAQKLWLNRTIVFFFLVLVAINLFLVINPAGWGEWLQNIYSPKPETNYLYYHEGGAFRLIGTQMNPNNNGLIFIMFAIYFFFGEKKMWRYSVLAMGIVLLTQSRTLIIIFAIITIIYMLTRIKSFNWKKNLPYAFVGFVLFGVLLFFSSSNLRSLLTGDAFMSHSLVNRINNAKVLVDANFKSVLFGKGYCLDQVGTLGAYVDSEFILILYQFGLLGLLSWLFMATQIFFSAKRDKEKRMFYLAFGVLLLLSAATNILLLNRELNLIFVTFIAVVYFGQPTLERIKPKNKPISV